MITNTTKLDIAPKKHQIEITYGANTNLAKMYDAKFIPPKYHILFTLEKNKGKMVDAK